MLLLPPLLLLHPGPPPRPQSEPGEGYNTVAGSTVMARYNLTVWNMKPGATYTTYRFPGRLPPRKSIGGQVL